jgi:hypothetical protein
MTSTTNLWDFLSTLATVAIPAAVTVVTYRLTRKSTKADAQEVKEELAVAKTELKQDAAVREAKLDTVHTLVNGDRAAKEARILALESKLRDHGIAE